MNRKHEWKPQKNAAAEFSDLYEKKQKTKRHKFAQLPPLSD